MPLSIAQRSKGLLKDVGLVAVIAIIAIALSIASRTTDSFTGESRNAFLNTYNLVTNVATPMSVYAIMAVGMTVVIITSGIDISVGSIMGLSAIMTAWLSQSLPEQGSPLIVVPILVIVPMLIGLTCGLLNGLLIVSLRLHPFIVTLCTLIIFRWAVNVFPPQKTMPIQGHNVPFAFTKGLMQLKAFDVEIMPLIIMLIVTAAGALYLRMTVPGVQTYAVGGNEEAAKLSGVRVNAIKIGAYLISGLCAGIAGLVSLGRFETASATTGTGYELSVVAAAVVGGASLSGGRGAALGALLGALVIRLIENGIVVLGWNQEHQLGIVGLAILIAVTMDRLLNSRSR